MVKMTKKALLVFIGLLLVKGIVSAQNKNSGSKKITVLNVTEPVPQAATRIKKVAVGGDEVSGAYSYDDVISKIQDIAEEWQANLVKIEQHERGDAQRCDRVVATLYSVDATGIKTAAAPDYLPDSYSEGDFVWSKTRKLAWRDFQGSIPRLSKNDMTVAATYCGFGYEMSYNGNNKPVLSIKNRFYVDKSWGLDEFRNREVLEHEQAHFDLCEIYTRKFRELANKRIQAGTNYKKIIQSAYDQVYGEYERQQERYDSETEHGNNKEAQKRWQMHIETQLQETEGWHEA